MTDRLMKGLMVICDSRIAFATEKVVLTYIWQDIWISFFFEVYKTLGTW